VPHKSAPPHPERPGNPPRDSDRGRRHESRPDRDRHGARSEGHKGDRRRDEQRRNDRGDRRRDDRREDRKEPRAITASPPRSKSGAESDSPFASLLALRAQLEQSQRDKG
jgi:ATP-dependent RNA helicase SUPV3L1/SUV3